jgi:putative two-component system hydrogenase maturation factor HypX/HoxX
VGQENANKLLGECVPISSQKAKSINMIDEIFDINSYDDDLQKYCTDLVKDENIYDDFIEKKEAYLEQNQEFITSCKDNEIKTMYDEFWSKDSIFHQLRYNFVYKICESTTPNRVKYRSKHA